MMEIAPRAMASVAASNTNSQVDPSHGLKASTGFSLPHLIWIKWSRAGNSCVGVAITEVEEQWEQKWAAGISFPFREERSRMDNQLASAMATIAFTAVLLVLALFHVERIHTPSSADEPKVQLAANR